ncbi:MAG: hypothetical protein KKA73_01130 [Chloroflexi bacterium]|nr:hypothetical protein [Chloroflexota bacterium]MBU1746267.1 hypothetical protein [Chloroflexota bacterium]
MKRRFVICGVLFVFVLASAACDLTMGGQATPAASAPAGSPTATTDTPLPTEATPTVAPSSDTATRIQFQPGATMAVVQGTVPAGGMTRYVLTVLAGQTLSLALRVPQREAVLAVWGADGTVLLSDHVGATHWSWPVPTTQDYAIDVKSMSSADAAYTLEVTIPASPAPNPQPGVKRIQFQAGSASATEYGRVAANQADHYVLRAQGGQTMTVNVVPSQGQAILIIWGQDGTVLISDHVGAAQWSGLLPTTQDYFIDVRAVGGATVEYMLQVSIPPGPNPTPVTRRIQFPLGGTTATEQGTTAGGQMDVWSLRAMAGQAMTVNVSAQGDNVILVIWGQDGTVLISDHAEARDWSGTLPSTQDYYIGLKPYTGATSSYILTVTIPPVG